MQHNIARSSDYEDNFFQLPNHLPVVALPQSLVRSPRFFYKKGAAGERLM
ncbi:hypothetical protein [Legionella rowbothamii]|nr:hypothetical protein [Legionella rowbothamii]